MKAYIFAGGAIDAVALRERPDAADLTVAADSGWHNAKALGVVPKVLLGDFDSIGGIALPEAEEILKVPPEKDRTDTQLAVDLALSRGANDFVIIGGLSGRLDHTMSNLFLLEYPLKSMTVLVFGMHCFYRERQYLTNRSIQEIC